MPVYKLPSRQRRIYTNHRETKKFCIAASSTQRLLRIPALILFLLFAPRDTSLLLGFLLAFMILIHALGALSGVALVDDRRGAGGHS
jgi:hypothetical protein